MPTGPTRDSTRKWTTGGTWDYRYSSGWWPIRWVVLPVRQEDGTTDLDELNLFGERAVPSLDHPTRLPATLLVS